MVLNQFEYTYVTDAKEGYVPEEIAIEGKPAISVYLCGVHRHSTEEVAEKMGVARETVTKYITRFDPKKRTE